MKFSQRSVFIAAFVFAIASLSIVASYGTSKQDQRPKADQPTNRPEQVTQAPQVISKIKGLVISGVELINQGTAQASIVIDVMNNRDEGVMFLDFVSRDHDFSGGQAIDGLLDENHPIVVIPPHSLKSFTMNVGEIVKGAPLVLTAASFSDGKEEGDKRSLAGIHKTRETHREKVKNGDPR